MGKKKKSPSTALERTDGKLHEREARAMSSWRIILGTAPARLRVRELRDADTGQSYLVVETVSNRIVGVLRGGRLDARPENIPPAETVCTLFVAAQA
ncbi:MAG: hypothetical protein QY323_03595 [Patescibacteria group bacterium]|nr:MAG: hypothetical protein QY323_03595 [Patescibacteria group bacterium]